MTVYKILKTIFAFIFLGLPCVAHASETYNAVGTPKGVVDVSSTGAATYSLNFELPDGGPLTPKIGLTYNSQQAGYGLAGYGFSITGISAITRGGKDLFHDGTVAGVTYTAADNLFLDGRRLVLRSGTPGKAGAVYTVEGDPFTKVTEHGFYNNTLVSTYFIVTTTSGMTYQYGKSKDSRLTFKDNGGRERIASWYVNRVTNQHSDYTTYEYATSDLCIRPVTVTYGLNAAVSRGITCKVAFTYQELGDNARPFAIGDRQGKNGVCLSSVTTSCNSYVYRKYTFNYDNQSDMSQGKWTRLTAIEETNGDGEKLPPVSFQWQYLPFSYTRASELDVPTDNGNRLTSETEKYFLSADLNGDGKSDIIRIAPIRETTAVTGGGASYKYYTNVYVSRSKVASTGSVTYEPPLVYTLPSGISMGSIKSMYGGASVTDFDGDGYNDLVIPFQNTFTGHWSQAVFYLISGSGVVAGKSGVPQAFAVSLKSTDKAPLFVTLDVDGDGKDDVVCVEQRKKNGCYPCTIVRHTGGTELSLTEISLTLPQGVSKNIEKAFAGDYNNDGLPDLILLYKGGYKIYFNNGGTATASVFTEDNTMSGNDFGDSWRIEQGDFDGDGQIDFVYNRSGESTLRIAHNNSDGTFSHTQTQDLAVSNQDTDKDDSRFAIRVLDMDHDGLSDIVVSKAIYSKNKYTRTSVLQLCSTGSGFKYTGIYGNKREADADEGSIFLGDFDGDGNIELANYGSVLNSADSTSGQKINVYMPWKDQTQVSKIVGITDGMGNKISIEYASATSPTVYKRSINGAYPVNTYTLPISVVGTVTSDNGFARSQTVKYSYGDLRLHISGRGMLGFDTVTRENTTMDTRETTSITGWDKSLWIPTETKTTNSVGNSTSTSISKYSISTSGNNYFAYVSEKDITDLDGNTTTTITNYDTEKGVVADETVSNDGDIMYKKVTYSGYEKKDGMWLPTTMTMTQKHVDDAEPYTTVTTYGYDSTGDIISTTINSGTNMALTTTSTYDAYGNVLSSVTTGNGIKPVTKYNTYDPSGRFVVKNFSDPASTVNTFTYDLWGNVLTESDTTEPSNILTTSHTYDGWGRKLTTRYADGTQTRYETGWGTDDLKKYYTKETTTGKPAIKTWYDKGGYEVLWESAGIKGLPFSRNTHYNYKGQVSEVRNSEGKRTSIRYLTYDNRGRTVSDSILFGKAFAYSYGNRSVTTATAGRAYTKTYDAWGNIIRSADPVSEVCFKYSSVGKPSSVETQGSTVAMAYDAAGNRTFLSDPDAGTSYYTYAADGTLLTQTDGRGLKTVNCYDDLGRLFSSQTGQQTVEYTYGTTGNEKLRLTGMSAAGNTVEYTHDRFGRVITEKRNIAGHGSCDFSYDYNANGQLAKTTYPGGVEVSYMYDDNGYRTQASTGGKAICKVDSVDGYSYTMSFMDKLTATRTCDLRGYETSRTVTKGSDNLDALYLNYDHGTGNLLSRYRKHGFYENFAYDCLDRLVSVTSNGKETMKTDYAPNGNILFKTGVGGYSYGESVRPHAVTEVENTNGEIPGDALTTSFNDLGKIGRIEDAGKGLSMDFVYGPGRQRWYSSLTENGTDIRTTVYAGDYEKLTEDGTTREFYYLDGNTIIIKEDGEIKPYFAFTDNLGSILSVMDEEGNKVFDSSYDAWGRQTVRLNTIGLCRGYTGHEMISEFDIINMNGRLYDPVLGRFLSPDNYVQMPDFSQSFNRYSYCLNNPLRYTDPSGELIGIDDAIALAVFSMAGSMMQASVEGGNVWKAGALSLLSSAASYGIGAAFGSAGNLGHELLRAGAHGLASGVVSSLDGGNFLGPFVSGAAASGIGSYAQGVNMSSGLMVASTTAMGGVVAWATGGDFLQGAMQGMSIGLFNHYMHGGDGSIRYYHDRSGNIRGEIPEVVVVPTMHTGDNAIGIAAEINTVLGSAGTSLKINSGNSTWGSNHKFYWHTASKSGFYGNQYVKTIKLAQIGKGLSKVASPAGKLIDGIEIYNSYKQDGSQIGFHTIQTTIEVAGSWGGTIVGSSVGASIGASTGVWFGGVGIIPGTIIGGALGGIVGSIGGSWLGVYTAGAIYE